MKIIYDAKTGFFLRDGVRVHLDNTGANMLVGWVCGYAKYDEKLAASLSRFAADSDLSLNFEESTCQ